MMLLHSASLIKQKSLKLETKQMKNFIVARSFEQTKEISRANEVLLSCRLIFQPSKLNQSIDIIKSRNLQQDRVETGNLIQIKEELLRQFVQSKVSSVCLWSGSAGIRLKHLLQCQIEKSK